MSLTRYLPTPSDRMGILWNLLTVKESIVLEYGPAGTTHFSMSLYGDLGVEQENQLFTTHMSEDDVVMGDVTRLEDAIVELDQDYHPKVIFVVGSSIASVIGTDIKGVCNYMQDQVQARLVCFDQGGFRGDYSLGCQAVWSLLAKEFPKPGEVWENVYNLVGVSAGSYRMRSDVWELQNLMSEAFHMTLGTSFCMDTGVGALEQAGSARLNLVLRDEAREAAEILEERCGTPWVFGMPYGYQATLDWLREIGKALGREPEQSVIDRLREKAMKAAMYKMYGRMLKQDKAGAVLVGEYHTLAGLGRFLSGMGIPVEASLCSHSLRLMDAPKKPIIHPETERERMDILEKVHRKLILGDDISFRMCPKDNVFLRISLPAIRGAQTANHLPLMGEKGADFILETVEEYFQLVQ